MAKTFEYFIEEYKFLNENELRSKLMLMTPLETNTYDTTAQRKLEKLSEISVNSRNIDKYTDLRIDIKDFTPILIRMQDEYIQVFLEKNFPEFL